MSAAFEPLRGRVQEVSASHFRIDVPGGASYSLPLSACETPIAVGDEMVLFAVPIGGKSAGETDLAKHLLNRLLSKE